MTTVQCSIRTGGILRSIESWRRNSGRENFGSRTESFKWRQGFRVAAPHIQRDRTIIARYNSGDFRPQKSNFSKKSRESRLKSLAARELLQRYVLPVIGLFTAATIIGPIVGGLFVSVVGFSLAIAALAATLSLSWILVPLIVGMFGIPFLMGTAMIFTGAFASMMLPSLFATVALLGGGLYLGSKIAQYIFFAPEQRLEDADVQIRRIQGLNASVDSSEDESGFDPWVEAENELREFDSLLERREKFRRGL